MADTKTINDLKRRVEALENHANNNKNKVPRAPRAPSAYNNFMSKFIEDNKASGKSHQELFKAGATEWGKIKDSKGSGPSQ
jgi:hypothetical protein